MKKMSFLLLLCGLMAAQAYCGGQQQQTPAAAQGTVNWPTKTVQLVANGNPGGEIDFNSRVFIEALQRELGQPFVVVNNGAGGGSVAGRQVYESAPDGYTVLVCHNGHGCSVALGMIDSSYADYEMVGIIGESAGDVMVVNKSSPWKTMADVVNAAKENPGKLRLAVNRGSTSYVIAAAFAAKSGTSYNIVDGGGAADKAVALLGGHIDVSIITYGTAKPYIESGDFIPLGISSEKRNPKFPDIPTYVENGYDVVFPIRYCFLMPPKTPREIVDKFSKAVEKIIREDKEYAKVIDSGFAQSPFFMPPKEALAFYDSVMPLINEHISK